MSKKVFTLATTRCGYCKMTENYVLSKYPGVGDKYVYFNADTDDMTPLANTVYNFAIATNVRGVPFTVLLENGIVKSAIRGYDPNGISKFIEEVLEEPETGQMEIPFKEHE